LYVILSSRFVIAYFYLVICHPENDWFVVSDGVIEVTGTAAGMCNFRSFVWSSEYSIRMFIMYCDGLMMARMFRNRLSVNICCFNLNNTTLCSKV
jgi:hypothetical protein